jgi:hypothetical protein
MLPQGMIDQHVKGGFRYDPDLMWYWTSLPHERMGVNAVGFRRSKSMMVQKPEDIIRVIALGDSQVYGGGASVDETFSHYAEEGLGESWEVLNAGISGYRSLNIYRLLRKKMLRFEPDIILVDAMMWDSPRENGDLHESAQLPSMILVEEILWNSRLNYVVQLALRNAGIQMWEDVPWPIHLQEVRKKEGAHRGEGLGNHEQISHWAHSRGILAIFMEYPTKTGRGELSCVARTEELPQPVFATCSVLLESGLEMSELFFDSNHFTPLGARIVGDALAKELPIMFSEWKQ